MNALKLAWHISRHHNTPVTNQRLARFCEKNKTKSEVTTEPYLFEDGKKYFNITYYFDNGGWIEAELQAGDENQGYTVADHFQVADYRLEGGN